MQNNHPKSETPATKERASAAKDKMGRERSMEREKTAPHNGRHGVAGVIEKEDLNNPRDGRGPLRKQDDQSTR
jgi:hypothetical protein